MSILTLEALACAQRMNLYYSRRLRWPLPRGFRDVQSADFAYHVARMQRDSRRLNIDGIMGPKTDAFVRGRAWVPPASNEMIIGGEPMAVNFPIVTFENPEGLSFYGQDGWDTRTDPTGGKVDLAVLHWDECISSHQCFHVLLMRRLSAHFLLDGDGTVYQTLDPADVRAWHARQFNDRAVGIEIQNPVWPNNIAPYGPRRQLVPGVKAHTQQPWQHLDFTQLQHKRVMALTQAVCKAMNIPMQLPLDGNTVMTSLMPPKFKGVCGHYHLTQDKIDPGLSPWPQMQKAWHPETLIAAAAEAAQADKGEEVTAAQGHDAASPTRELPDAAGAQAESAEHVPTDDPAKSELVAARNKAMADKDAKNNAKKDAGSDKAATPEHVPADDPEKSDFIAARNKAMAEKNAKAGPKSDESKTTLHVPTDDPEKSDFIAARNKAVAEKNAEAEPKSDKSKTTVHVPTDDPEKSDFIAARNKAMAEKNAKAGPEANKPETEPQDSLTQSKPSETLA